MAESSRFVQTLDEVAKAFGVFKTTPGKWIRMKGAPAKIKGKGYDVDAIREWWLSNHCTKVPLQSKAPRSRDRDDPIISQGSRVLMLAEVLSAAGDAMTLPKIRAAFIGRDVPISKNSLQRDLCLLARLGYVDDSGRNGAGNCRILFRWRSERLEIVPPEQPGQPAESQAKAPRRQDPTWAELWEGVAKKKWTEGQRRGNAARQWVAVANHIIDTGRDILRRPATLADLNIDICYLIIRRFLQNGMKAENVRKRAERLEELSKYATRRFNHPKIDFDEIPVVRRLSFEALPSDPRATCIPLSDDIPAGFDSKLLAIPLDKALGQYVLERLVGRSPETERLMRVAVRQFSRWLARQAVVGDLRRERVLEYLHAMLSSGRVSRGTVRTHQERLLALWRFAARKRWLPDFPDLPLVTVPDRVPDAWSRDEMASMLDAAQRQKGEIGEVPASLFWETLIHIINDTGERIAASLSVRLEDVSDSGWLTVRAEFRKGKTRDKAYKLRPCTLECIKRIRKTTGRVQGAILPWPHCKTYLWKMFGNVLDDADLPRTRRTMFHKIRRTTASDFEAAGGNATELLDHSNRSTTKKYLDPSVLKQAQPADLVPGIGEAITKAAVSAGADGDLMDSLQRLLDQQRQKRGQEDAA